MMGDEAFILFNGGRLWLESPKHAEIRLAILLKMLPIAHFGAGALAALKKGHRLHSPLFPRDMANSPGLVRLSSLSYLVHSFRPAIGRVFV
jgi:hypothetical protein